MQTTERQDHEMATNDAAVQLARAIKALPQWEELQAARAHFRADPELSTIMARYRRAFGRWTAARAQGQHLAGEDALELAESQDLLQSHRLFRRQHEATEALVGILREINGVLSVELGLDFAANAAPPGGCCG